MSIRNRHRTFSICSADLSKVVETSMAAVECMKPTRLDKSVACANAEGAAVRIDFRAAFFRRRVTNFNTLLGIGAGSLAFIPDESTTKIQLRLDVTRSLLAAILPVAFINVGLMYSGLWLWSLLPLAIYPVWAWLLSESYVGTFCHQIECAIHSRLTDDRRRGFEVAVSAP
jgi:hypothetical protein